MSSPSPKRTYMAPKKTTPLVKGHLDRCQNLRLILDRFVPQEVLVNEEEALPSGKKIAARYNWLSTELLNGQRINTKLWEEMYLRWLARRPPETQTTFAALDWRMVVGLGGQSVLETHLTLDHLSGLPVIPGSALKGLTRAYAIQEVYKWLYAKDKEGPEHDPPEVKDRFGTQEQAGKLIFFDALPVPPSQADQTQREYGVRPEVHLEVDMMNVHYPAYYRSRGGEAPANDQKLNPISFLTVAAATFALAVAPRADGTEDQAKQAMEWMLEALKKYGVGSKTSAGYGVLTALHPKTTRDVALEKTGGKSWLRGTVQERTEAGAIVVFENKDIALRGFIPNARFGGRKLEPSNLTPKCEVLGIITHEGQEYIELDCPPK